jgi:hypothetical protein
MEDDMANDRHVVTVSITGDVIAGLDPANPSIVIPGRAEREPQMCNCTSGNAEIPGLVPSDHPGMTRTI